MENLIKKFNSEGFNVSFFNDREEAISQILGEVSNKIVSFGGSKTLEELSLYEKLSCNNKVFWHWKNDNLEIAKAANVYFLSANAITRDGKIINIDGTGNRISMSLFGPKECYYIVGVNKITNDLNEGILRAKNIAAVKNAKRLKLNTPCVTLDRCIDCNHKDRICRATMILDRPMNGMKVNIIIINENLGY